MFLGWTVAGNPEYSVSNGGIDTLGGELVLQGAGKALGMVPSGE